MKATGQRRTMSPTPYDQVQIKQSLRSMGRNVSWKTIGKTFQIYSRLIDNAPTQGVAVATDVNYGPHERHRLDIYTPHLKSDRLRPILVFVHGGGFFQGDKCREKHLGYYFARHGFMTILVNYRLAPAYQWPAGIEDIAAVLEWISHTGPAWGGDDQTVFLMGHSAGAAHVASYLFIDGVRPKMESSVAGAILLSGPTYDTRCLNPHKDLVYYGNDASRYPAMSVIDHIDGPTLPVFIAYAELDPVSVEYQSVTLYNKLYDHDQTAPTLMRLMGHNHISEIMHIGTADEALGPDIVAFIQATLETRPPVDATDPQMGKPLTAMLN